MCADVLSGAVDATRRRPGATMRCRACAAGGCELLSMLKQRVGAQAKLSGQAPSKFTSVARQLATPKRSAEALAEARARLASSKALNKQCLELLRLEGVDLSPAHADVVDKVVEHLDGLRVDDLDADSAADLAEELSTSPTACDDEARALPARARLARRAALPDHACLARRASHTPCARVRSMPARTHLLSPHFRGAPRVRLPGVRRRWTQMVSRRARPPAASGSVPRAQS